MSESDTREEAQAGGEVVTIQSATRADVAAVRPSAEALELLYDEVGADQLRQLGQIDHLNSRAQQILAVGGATLGIVVALRPPTARLAVSLLTLGALVIYGLAALFALLAWQVESYRSDPNPGALWEKHRHQSVEFLRHQIILNRIESRTTNDGLIKRKVTRVKWAQRLLAVEIIYLVLLLIVRPYI